jgi:hypothetical protein
MGCSCEDFGLVHPRHERAVMGGPIDIGTQ